MGKFLVMDIVFSGNSLNYDQGIGNYQELKKITKWDGKQYTFVSRYALRYSLLETAKDILDWKLAQGDELQRAGNAEQTVIQPALKLLLNGDILNYPEFDLFGYLITSTNPQNFREAPVKISHAVSLTPFTYDAPFNANIGLANRMRRKFGEMSPNPFTSEEHMTFYQYSIVVDFDNVGKLSVYLKKGTEIDLGGSQKFIVKNVEIAGSEINLIGQNKDNKILQSDLVHGEKDIESSEDLFIINYSLKDTGFKEERVKQLIKAIINLKRNIKGRNEDLSPKLLIMGIYKNTPYKSYKDKISLLNEYTEDEYDEIEEKEENNKRIVRVKHVLSKSKKPVFDVKGVPDKCETDEYKIMNFSEELFKEDNIIEKVKLFYTPEIEIR